MTEILKLTKWSRAEIFRFHSIILQSISIDFQYYTISLNQSVG